MDLKLQSLHPPCDVASCCNSMISSIANTRQEVHSSFCIKPRARIPRSMYLYLLLLPGALKRHVDPKGSKKAPLNALKRTPQSFHTPRHLGPYWIIVIAQGPRQSLRRPAHFQEIHVQGVRVLGFRVIWLLKVGGSSGTSGIHRDYRGIIRE